MLMGRGVQDLVPLHLPPPPASAQHLGFCYSCHKIFIGVRGGGVHRFHEVHLERSNITTTFRLR